VKLLFDENLSPRLCFLLADLFPGSESVLNVGLGGRPDTEVWKYATDQTMIVVGKDSDFVERAMLSSNGGKFVWLRLGNCTTQAAHLALRNGYGAIAKLQITDDLVLELP
jgi:predicted nuclease of predicted toxin-antitoxin system